MPYDFHVATLHLSAALNAFCFAYLIYHFPLLRERFLPTTTTGLSPPNASPASSSLHCSRVTWSTGSWIGCCHGNWGGVSKAPWLLLLTDKELSHGWLHGIPLNNSVCCLLSSALSRPILHSPTNSEITWNLFHWWSYWIRKLIFYKSTFHQ